MKVQSKLNLLGLFLLLTSFSFAQEGKAQAFWIHEDNVKPSMRLEYEKASKDLVEACKTHNAQNIQWSLATMDDGTYLSITPIENLADIQNMNFSDVQEKMGEEAFSRMFDNFTKCYDDHGDYITMLLPSLSYMPDGLSTDTPGKNYRVWHRMDVSAGNLSGIETKMKELKELFTARNSKMHYRIYRSGFGNVGDYYVAVISAKDAVDYDTMSIENDRLLGEEGKKIFGEIFQLVEAYDVKRGGMRPDLAYQPIPAVTNTVKD